MAYLTGTRRIYLFVRTENNAQSISASEHSVETGADLTDHVKADAEEISLDGIISGRNYKNIVKVIKNWEKSGTRVNYSGNISLSGCLIHNFRPSFSADIQNGCTFSMELKKVRIAAPSYVVQPNNSAPETKETTNTGTNSVEVNNTDGDYHTVKSGDTVWSLVNGAYKKYGKSCQDIMIANPEAFSRKGDFKTLKVGAKLKMN